MRTRLQPRGRKYRCTGEGRDPTADVEAPGHGHQGCLDMQVFTCILDATHMDRVFKALADPSRRQLLDRLFEANGQTLGDLCRNLDMSRQAVTQHLSILEG